MALTKGSVTPFGILNDAHCRVEIVLDKDILLFPRIGVHPNENTATIFIHPQNLEFIIRNHGNSITYIEI